MYRDIIFSKEIDSNLKEVNRQLKRDALLSKSSAAILVVSSIGSGILAFLEIKSGFNIFSNPQALLFSGISLGTGIIAGKQYSDYTNCCKILTSNNNELIAREATRNIINLVEAGEIKLPPPK